VVEHPLGKGEVVSSILTSSTGKTNDFRIRVQPFVQLQPEKFRNLQANPHQIRATRRRTFIPRSPTWTSRQSGSEAIFDAMYGYRAEGRCPTWADVKHGWGALLVRRFPDPFVPDRPRKNNSERTLRTYQCSIRKTPFLRRETGCNGVLVRSQKISRQVTEMLLQDCTVIRVHLAPYTDAVP
jgi:hypothetical protein